MNQQNLAPPPVPRASFLLARMSTGIAVLTWIFCALAIAVPISVLYLAPEMWMSLVLAAIIWGVCRFVWSFYRPKYFEVLPDGLQIVWPWRSMFIPSEEITEIVPMSKEDLGLVIRTWGAGGLWGGFGKHWSRKIGHMLIYASRSDKLVCIRRVGKRPILITPEDCEEFIAAVRKSIPAEGGG